MKLVSYILLLTLAVSVSAFAADVPKAVVGGTPTDLNWYWKADGSALPENVKANDNGTLKNVWLWNPDVNLSNTASVVTDPLDSSNKLIFADKTPGLGAPLRWVNDSTGAPLAPAAKPIRSGISSGSTCTFRIKVDPTTVTNDGSNAMWDFFRINYKATGSTISDRFGFKIGLDANNKATLQTWAGSSGNLDISDGKWHTVWVSSLWNGTTYVHKVWWDGQFFQTFNKTDGTSTNAKMGVQSNSGMADIYYDYIAFYDGGAYDLAAVPEPAGIFGLASGLLGFAGMAFRKRRR